MMFILLSLWRRILGGWLSLRRSYIVFFAFIPFINYLPDYKIFLIYYLSTIIYFTIKGHTWDKGFIPLFIRYSLPLSIIQVILLYCGIERPLLSIAGFLIALSYSFGNYLNNKGFTGYNKFIDGGIAISELLAGGLFYLGVTYV